jgi:hypothetical protein
MLAASTTSLPVRIKNLRQDRIRVPAYLTRFEFPERARRRRAAVTPGEDQSPGGFQRRRQHRPEPPAVVRLQRVHHVDHHDGFGRIVQSHAQRITGEHGHPAEQLRARVKAGQQHSAHSGRRLQGEDLSGCPVGQRRGYQARSRADFQNAPPYPGQERGQIPADLRHVPVLMKQVVERNRDEVGHGRQLYIYLVVRQRRRRAWPWRMRAGGALMVGACVAPILIPGLPELEWHWPLTVAGTP